MDQGKTTSSLTGEKVEERGGDNITADICIIGADRGGLAIAAAAAAFGRSVVLVERDQLGGGPLSHGVVAQRALAAAANRAYAMRNAGVFNIPGREADIDMRAINQRITRVVEEVTPNVTAERFAGFGVRMVHGAAHFVSRKAIMAGEQTIRARRFVIATGAAPVTPAIPGLGSVPYSTTETIFSNPEKLHNLIIIGGDSSSLELAQTYSRLGSRVIVLEPGKVLAAEDPELAKFVVERLTEEGIGIYENTKVNGVEGGLGRVKVNVTVDGENHVVEGSHLLVAAGRKPATADLGLEAAGIRYDERGIKVNGGLKTTNRRVFALGEVAAAPGAQAADYQAGIVMKRALLHTRARLDENLIPRVAFTCPQLAYVGLNEAQATKSVKKIHVLRWPYRENDRAVAEGATAGHVKVITNREGKILGAGIVGRQAGELIGVWALALSQGLDIKALTEWVPPYLTLGEINGRVATSYYAGRPGNPTLRKVIDFLAKFG
jgi:pyruvate/2-oxoglutarate dehydrogenase complex dihydrolipoamide dehydrogenase (E3) component